MRRAAHWRWLVVFATLSACVDSIDFNAPPAESQIVVEGMISDQPGPYVVKVSTAMDLNSDTIIRIPMAGLTVTLYDDTGKSENFIEVSPGEYQTAGVIQGEVGHFYHIKLITPDDMIFESEPDEMKSTGELQNIKYEYEARTVRLPYGDSQADVFNVYVDGNAGLEAESFVRWRYTGTYQVITTPELHTRWLQGFILKDPVPCSGYVVEPALGGGVLEKVSECTCCACWVNQYELQPQLSDVQLVSSNQFRNVKVGEVPINQATFDQKYRIYVEQMSLSRNAFDFFKLIRSQKEGASSLFQPPSGKLIGNIKSLNAKGQVIGLFWATSIQAKEIYLKKEDLPYPLPPIYVPDACNIVFPTATTTKPAFWE